LIFGRGDVGGTKALSGYPAAQVAGPLSKGSGEDRGGFVGFLQAMKQLAVDASKAMFDWAEENGVRQAFIQPGMTAPVVRVCCQ